MTWQNYARAHHYHLPMIRLPQNISLYLAYKTNRKTLEEIDRQIENAVLCHSLFWGHYDFWDCCSQLSEMLSVSRGITS